MARKRKYVKRDVFKLQIYELLLSAERPVTRGEILRHMRVHHSRWTDGVFAEMVRENWLIKHKARLGNLVVYTFEANDLGKGL